MRVGVDYRILSGGPASATRGMPRYTQQQLREVLAAGSDHEYLLLCDARTDQSLILPEIRTAPNVDVRLIPAEATFDVHRDDLMLSKAAIFESWLAAQHLDVYHCTAPFFLDQLIVAQLDACPYVATVYDLIPLVYPAQYLAPPDLRRRYLRAAAMVTGATRLLAISGAARRDASLYLGIPEDRIDVAPPFAEPFFRPMSAGEVAAELAPLAARIDLGRPFILSVTDLHFTKNVETLLRGYAQLPDPIRKASPLVVACHLSEESADTLARVATRLGVGGRVCTTGLVTDLQLAALYNAATFVVHPSRYEGFGLPVLEAMQCGTPVITTTSSSLPEVAGDACILVEPDDAPALVAAMEALWDDPSERDRLRGLGFERSSAFTGTALAQATLAAYDRAAVPAEPPTRPRIVQWAAPEGGDQPLSGPDDRLNKVCEIEDLSDPALFPNAPTGVPVSTEDWRTAMALRTMKECGALHSGAVILGVGAATGHVAFHLTRHVAKVIATDRYLRPGSWTAEAPPVMLVDPSSAAPFPFDAARLVVRHMDGRVLGFGDDTFDGIYSSGSIQRAGDLEDIASVAYEMGRVLKPGGVLSVSTDLLLGGPPGGRGTPDTPLLSPAHVRRYIVEASGLELVDELRLTPSPATLARLRDHFCPESRQIIGVTDGYVFLSVHLALRKTEGYPAVPNGWARPSPELRRMVEAESLQVVANAPDVEPARSGATRHSTLCEGTARIDALHARTDANVAALREEEASAGRCLAAIEATASIVDAGRTTADHPGWRWGQLVLPGGTELEVVVDPKAPDGLAGETPSGTVGLVGPGLLLLPDLVEPGDVVVDIGAGTGIFSLAAAAAGCRVVALDPSPTKVMLLRATAARNGFTDMLVVNLGATEAAVDALLGELGVGAVALVRIGPGHAEVPALLGMVSVLAGVDVVLFSSEGADAGGELETMGFRVIRLDGPEETGSFVDYLAGRGPVESLAQLEVVA